MKKIYLTLSVLFISTTIWAQNYDFKLINLYSNDFLDSVYFHYDDSNVLDYYYMSTPDSPNNIEIIDSIFYNESGYVIAMHTYQLLDGDWMHTNIIDYTYDENGNRATRTNYVNFGWGMEIQGVYNYTYNDENQLTYHEMTLGGSMFERCNYSYNGQGLLQEKVIEMYYSWESVWDFSSKTVYEYNTDGYQSKISSYYWTGTSWSADSRNEYEYDTNGNCSVRTYYSGNTLSDRKTYTYDLDTDIEKVIMPYHPEPFYMQFEQFMNRPLSYKWESLDDNGQLVYLCDFLYDYEKLNGTGIQNPVVDDMLRVYPNPAAESIMVNLPGLKKVDIVNMQGATVQSVNTVSDFSRIDLQNLAGGIYLIKAFDGKSWQVSKIVVQ